METQRDDGTLEEHSEEQEEDCREHDEREGHEERKRDGWELKKQVSSYHRVVNEEDSD